MNLFLLEVRGPPNIVVESGIAAIDHRVALVEQRRDGLNGLLRRRAGWDHDPDRARGLELADEIGQRQGADASNALGLLDQIRRSIIDHHPVPVTLQPSDHVHPHFPEPDEADFHRNSF